MLMVWFWTVTVVVVDAVCTVHWFARFAASAVWFLTLQSHPVVAAGIASTPADAVPPVPTLTVNDVAVPLITGDVPNPLDTVGAVLLNARVVPTL